MADEIHVRNWDKFQHRDVARGKVRIPPWIKLYTELMSDESYLALTPSRRSMLIGIWLEYARTRRALPDDTATLSRRLAQRVLKADLEALNHAGFIELTASNSPASRLHAAGLEEKREDKRLGTNRSLDDLQVTQQQPVEVPGWTLPNPELPARDTDDDDDIPF